MKNLKSLKDQFRISSTTTATTMEHPKVHNILAKIELLSFHHYLKPHKAQIIHSLEDLNLQIAVLPLQLQDPFFLRAGNSKRYRFLSPS